MSGRQEEEAKEEHLVIIPYSVHAESRATRARPSKSIVEVRIGSSGSLSERGGIWLRVDGCSEGILAVELSESVLTWHARRQGRVHGGEKVDKLLLLRRAILLMIRLLVE